ncbi:S8 family serine peptidase [Haloimpatiens sp. FM7330]|uniref:S8 family serine peptidase n=1 Tax=Haloimpatiens sp. FM7330 TaxID=3298610 RepID=UPI00362AFAD0
MKKSTLSILVTMALVMTGCSTNVNSIKTKSINTAAALKSESEQKNVKNSETKQNLQITRHPKPANFHRGKLDVLPKYNPNSNKMWQMDLRGYDLSDLNLQGREKDLMYADFDSVTKWPDKLPKDFNPNKIMEVGKNPGLCIRQLHKKGITGKGIGIAIIDQPLLVDHKEYKHNLKMYEEIHWPKQSVDAQMHGPAVASIAVGDTVGVAPEADLYYIAEQHGDFKDGEFKWDFTWLAKSIDRVLEVNKNLPKDKKIRVISISVGWNKDQKGYKEVTEAVERAKKQGIFVVSSSLSEIYGYFFQGLGKNPLKNSDNINSYEPGMWWAEEFYKIKNKNIDKTNESIAEIMNKMLLIPMDSRTTASPTGNDDYVFYREGGWSWSIPYIAGLYVLACQVNPDVTPDTFWNEALKTGDTIKIQHDGKKYDLGKIVNPQKMIENIKGNKNK